MRGAEPLSWKQHIVKLRYNLNTDTNTDLPIKFLMSVLGNYFALIHGIEEWDEMQVTEHVDRISKTEDRIHSVW